MLNTFLILSFLVSYKKIVRERLKNHSIDDYVVTLTANCCNKWWKIHHLIVKRGYVSRLDIMKILILIMIKKEKVERNEEKTRKRV